MNNQVTPVAGSKKILPLTLKRQWFLMILSGEKREEYREIKPYWVRRLFKHHEIFYISNNRCLDCRYRMDISGAEQRCWIDNHLLNFFETTECGIDGFKWQEDYFNSFDTIRFTNGYSKNAPTFDIECKGIRIGTGNPEWGGSGETFILSLGEILSKANIS